MGSTVLRARAVDLHANGAFAVKLARSPNKECVQGPSEARFGGCRTFLRGDCCVCSDAYLVGFRKPALGEDSEENCGVEGQGLLLGDLRGDKLVAGEAPAEPPEDAPRSGALTAERKGAWA
mmetsp:Transcript_85642/g.276444  ORF Transcript_85642/g.276444 Transcript_85642/m.276444 type:complete len:121 (+) Transcript_85642:233-595(+)